ncbi:ATP-binding protein [Patescibacteria group bacterium]|nr:ATP-binding protein [Patescibacteria group bacterium]
MPRQQSSSSPQEEQIQQLRSEGVTSLKDVLSPTAVRIDANDIQIGPKFSRTLYVFAYPRFLTSGWFSTIINLDRETDVSIFVEPLDVVDILKNLRRKLTEIEVQISEEEAQGKVRNPILETAYNDIEQLRDDLQQGTEKFFKFGLYITLYGSSAKDLDIIENEINSILEAKMVYNKPATLRQEQGFHTTSPLGTDMLSLKTNMNTSPVSTVFPFISSELSSGQGILYGINRHNNSLVLFDRFSLENANMVVFGKSGGGKSYASKLEILRLLMIGTDVIVIDPENEYQRLAETVGGSFFSISVSSAHHVNPFDLPPIGEGENPSDVLRSHILDLVGLIKIMVGALTPEEDSLLDKALNETYAARDITPDSDFSRATPPLLEDLQKVLQGMEGSGELALKLEKYTHGSYANFLNQHTNIDINQNLTVFNIRDMEEELRPIAMYIVLSYIWTMVRKNLKRRTLIVDEAWVLGKYEAGASFLLNIAKRGRKYYLGLTTITQDVNDFMSSSFGQPIISNSSIQMLFKQSPATIDIVQKTFNLTQEEKYLLLESGVGEGLFFAGLKHISIKVVASYSEDKIITSNPEEILALRQQSNQ